jgi:hypothetical protein
MGFFGTFTYSDGQWGASPKGGTYLRVDIHDSDIATVDFAPDPSGRGRFFMGFRPRDYFDDPAANDAVDNDAEARAFADWVKQTLGSEVNAEDIRSLLAEDGEEEPEDPFVEKSVRKLLSTIGLPPPAEFPR